MSEPLEDKVIIRIPALAPGRPLHFERSPRRVRVLYAGEIVADSNRVMLLHEANHLPVYYFPVEDVRMDLMTPTGHSTHCPYKGVASYWSLRAGGRVAENAAWGYQDPVPESDYLKGYVAFYWNQMDAWFEEDDEVFVHPRDPYHRVDVVNSSRHVQVVVAGAIVAETRRPRLLFETGLPTRYYIPKLDVRMDLLEASDTATRCPYKGTASYWSARIGDVCVRDIAWSYPTPIPECPKIENLVAFFNERVDALYVDGELMARPKTPWS